MKSIKNSMSVTLSVLSVLVFVATACAEPKGHLGKSLTAVEAPGVKVVQEDSRSILPGGGLAGEESTTFQAEARVDSVDLKSKTISLTLPDGQKSSFKVSDKVQNLPQVKSGDRVRVQYRQALAFEVREPTKEEIELSGAAVGGIARAPKGALPGGIAAAAGLAVVTIESIDKEKQELTIQASNGKSTTIHAKYPENLELIKKGQKAVVTFSESVIADVEQLQ